MFLKSLEPTAAIFCNQIKNKIKCRLALCSAFHFTPLRTRFTVLLSSIIASPDNPLLLALPNHDNVRHCRLVIYLCTSYVAALDT